MAEWTTPVGQIQLVLRILKLRHGERCWLFVGISGTRCTQPHCTVQCVLVSVFSGLLPM